MGSKIEEVARAICIASGYEPETWAAEPSVRNECRSLARAAIAAMREPTQAMTKVAADDILEGPGISAFLNWQDLSASRYRLMIDAALSEEQG